MSTSTTGEVPRVSTSAYADNTCDETRGRRVRIGCCAMAHAHHRWLVRLLVPVQNGVTVNNKANAQTRVRWGGVRSVTFVHCGRVSAGG